MMMRKKPFLSPLLFSVLHIFLWSSPLQKDFCYSANTIFLVDLPIYPRNGKLLLVLSCWPSVTFSEMSSAEKPNSKGQAWSVFHSQVCDCIAFLSCRFNLGYTNPSFFLRLSNVTSFWLIILCVPYINFRENCVDLP